jgi:hypothetical protein
MSIVFIFNIAIFFNKTKHHLCGITTNSIYTFDMHINDRIPADKGKNIPTLLITIKLIHANDDYTGDYNIYKM